MWEQLHLWVTTLDQTKLAQAAQACQLGARTECDRFDAICEEMARARLEHYRIEANEETLAAYQLGARVGRLRHRLGPRADLDEEEEE